MTTFLNISSMQGTTRLFADISDKIRREEVLDIIDRRLAQFQLCLESQVVFDFGQHSIMPLHYLVDPENG